MKNYSNKVKCSNVLSIKEDKNKFLNSIIVNKEKIELLKLQRLYKSGLINIEELSIDKIASLCKLYDEQIKEKIKSNEERKKKLLEYRRKYFLKNNI